LKIGVWTTSDDSVTGNISKEFKFGSMKRQILDGQEKKSQIDAFHGSLQNVSRASSYLENPIA
jgi:hypothetical protein